MIFSVGLVGFHHSRGPEIEYWCGEQGNWPNLPFQALPDGSHSFKETFTYFTLLHESCEEVTTLFAISCSQQIKSEELEFKEDDVTRSTVQKSIVVIFKKPIFGQIKDKLSIVTNVFFSQKDFTDKTIIDALYVNLQTLFDGKDSKLDDIDDSHLYIGLGIRKIVYDFRKNVLVILKAILLEKKILFYGSNVEELCNLQFGFISLIPNLMSHLQDCGSPLLNSYEKNLKMVTSFKSSDRKSVLKFLGFPLQVFGKGGIFSPYTPLQQLDSLKNIENEWYIIGTSNKLLLEQKDILCDILVNLDTKSIEIMNSDKNLIPALQLTYKDKRWMETVVNYVNDTWNDNDWSTPKNSQFQGSEDFIRWQFEDYLTGLLSTIKLDEFLHKYEGNELAKKSIPIQYWNENSIEHFNNLWINLWKLTKNYRMFHDFTDDRIFDIFEPRHVYTGVDLLPLWQQRVSKSLKKFQKREIDTSSKSSSHLTSLPKDSSNKPDLEIKDNSWSSWKGYFSTKKKKKDDLMEIPFSDDNIVNAEPDDLNLNHIVPDTNTSEKSLCSEYNNSNNKSTDKN